MSFCLQRKAGGVCVSRIELELLEGIQVMSHDVM